MDGYPDGIDETIFAAATEQEYRKAVAAFFADRDDATKPERGWPWPWDDSQLTDFSYAFDVGQVWISCFGHAWQDWKIKDDEETQDDGPKVPFPDMKARKNVAFDRRSGAMFLKIK